MSNVAYIVNRYNVLTTAPVRQYLCQATADLCGAAVVADDDASEEVRQTRAVRPYQTPSLEDVRSQLERVHI